jgi:hypothetical protein
MSSALAPVFANLAARKAGPRIAGRVSVGVSEFVWVTRKADGVCACLAKCFGPRVASRPRSPLGASRSRYRYRSRPRRPTCAGPELDLYPPTFGGEP